jgi:hypothetical protein
MQGAAVPGATKLEMAAILAAAVWREAEEQVIRNKVVSSASAPAQGMSAWQRAFSVEGR